MKQDLAAAARALAHEAGELALLAQSAEEARAFTATWSDDLHDSASLVERVAAVGMRHKLQDAVGRTKGLIEAAQVSA